MRYTTHLFLSFLIISAGITTNSYAADDGMAATIAYLKEPTVHGPYAVDKIAAYLKKCHDECETKTVLETTRESRQLFVLDYAKKLRTVYEAVSDEAVAPELLDDAHALLARWYDDSGEINEECSHILHRVLDEMRRQAAQAVDCYDDEEREDDDLNTFLAIMAQDSVAYITAMIANPDYPPTAIQ